MVLPITGFAQTDDKVEQKLSGEQLKDIKKNANNLKIAEKTQKKLIKKLEKGEMIDSNNPAKYTKEVNEALKVTAEEPLKEYTFEDGSKAVVSITEEKVQKKEDSIGILSTSCGSGYCNFISHKVKKETLIANVSFLVDFTLLYGSQYADRITDAWGQSVSVIGGELSGYPILKVRRGTEIVGGSRAEARLTFTYKNFNGTGTTDAELRLYVGRDTYSVSAINF